VPQGKGARFGKRPLQKLTQEKADPSAAARTRRGPPVGMTNWGWVGEGLTPEGVSYSRGELQQRAMGEATV
jgi:hypothetical protein